MTEETKLLVAAMLDVTEICDLIGWGSEELVEALDQLGVLDEHKHAFGAAVS